jgi:hypothetical protein
MNPSGVPRIRVSPPRAVRGDPQPGFASHTISSAVREAIEKYRPMRPKPALGPVAGSVWIIGGSSIGRRLELHLERLADRLQRPEVKLDVNDYSLANQTLGYSP